MSGLYFIIIFVPTIEMYFNNNNMENNVELIPAVRQSKTVAKSAFDYETRKSVQIND